MATDNYTTTRRYRRDRALLVQIPWAVPSGRVDTTAKVRTRKRARAAAKRRAIGDQ